MRVKTVHWLKSQLLGQAQAKKQAQEARVEQQMMDTQRAAYWAPLEGTSFGLSADNRVRVVLHNLATSMHFDRFIVFVIVINCIFLALDNPLLAGDWVIARDVTDIFVTIIFVVETIVKLVAISPRIYLRDVWNVLDTVVVLGCVLSLVPMMIFLKALRSLRPLRLIVRNEAMRVVLTAVLTALPTLSLVVVFMAIFWFVFAMIGVQLFAGQFWRCNDGLVFNQTQCVGNFTELQSVEPFLVNGALVAELPTVVLRQWENRFYNFDNPLNAFLALFQAASGNAWSDQMYDGMDVAGVGNQPIEENNPMNAMFFVLFFVVCAYFTLNLFIGAVVDNFVSQRAEADGSVLLTPEQRRWVLVKELIHRTRLFVTPPMPFGGIRRSVYLLVCYPNSQYAYDPRSSKDSLPYRPGQAPPSYFERFILFLIVVNAGLMLVMYEGIPQDLEDTLEQIGTGMSAVFLCEVILKVLAVGWTIFWRDLWNRFDFTVVLGNIVLSTIAPGVSGGANALRVIRLARVFRLFRGLKTIAMLTTTLYNSLPKFGNLFTLLFAFFFMYSVLGVQLFGSSPRLGDMGGFGFDRHANFEDFPSAMLTLFRVSTADAWGPIHAGARSDLGLAGSLYMVSFVLLVSYVMLNLFIAIILETFSTTGSHLENTLLDTFEEMSHHWNKYDQLALEYLPVDQFIEVLKQSKIGFAGREVRDWEVLLYLRKAMIPMAMKQRIQTRGVADYRPSLVVYFKPTLRALTIQVFGTDAFQVEDDAKKPGPADAGKESASKPKGPASKTSIFSCCCRKQAAVLHDLEGRTLDEDGEGAERDEVAGDDGEVTVCVEGGGRDKKDEDEDEDEAAEGEAEAEEDLFAEGKTVYVHEWFAAAIIARRWKRVRTGFARAKVQRHTDMTHLTRLPKFAQASLQDALRVLVALRRKEEDALELRQVQREPDEAPEGADEEPEGADEERTRARSKPDRKIETEKLMGEGRHESDDSEDEGDVEGERREVAATLYVEGVNNVRLLMRLETFLTSCLEAGLEVQGAAGQPQDGVEDSHHTMIKALMGTLAMLANRERDQFAERARGAGSELLSSYTTTHDNAVLLHEAHVYCMNLYLVRRKESAKAKAEEEAAAEAGTSDEAL